MRTGLSTGTYAAALAKACLLLLLGKAQELKRTWILLPDKRWVEVFLSKSKLLSANKAVAWTKKNAGDDPDLTHNLTLGCLARLRKDQEIVFKRGKGIGIITRPGLGLPVGEIAINPTPRKIILENLKRISPLGLEITFIAPLGEKIALKTFNPKLGIRGGISILGTTGRVRPFSKEAIIKTIELHLNSLLVQKRNPLILVGGNIGKKAALKLNLPEANIVEVSNYWHKAFSFLETKNIKDLIIFSHPGKILKFLNNNFYTHSKYSQSALTALTKYGFNPKDFNTLEDFLLKVKDKKILKKMISDVKRSILENFHLNTEKIKIYFINYKSRVIAYA